MQIREQNPKLAKQSSVLAVTMDNVYAFATSPRDSSNAKGVVFRFMPDMRQVGAALDVCFYLMIQRLPPGTLIPRYIRYIRCSACDHGM